MKFKRSLVLTGGEADGMETQLPVAGLSQKFWKKDCISTHPVAVRVEDAQIQGAALLYASLNMRGGHETTGAFSSLHLRPAEFVNRALPMTNDSDKPLHIGSAG